MSSGSPLDHPQSFCRASPGPEAPNEAHPPAAVAIGGVLLGVQFSAGAIAWLPELGRIGNKAAAALVGVATYDDDSGGPMRRSPDPGFAGSGDIPGHRRAPP
jgi:hypothetical protein